MQAEEVRLERLNRNGYLHELLFRGQPNAKWGLTTTLERTTEERSIIEYYKNIEKIKVKLEIGTGHVFDDIDITGLQKQLSNYNDISIDQTVGILNHSKYLIYLRHFGFPSPLLDWSKSLYIAAFFAFREVIKDSSAVSIYLFDEYPISLHGSDLARVVRIGNNRPAHKRHFTQQSEYTYCTKFDSNKNSWFYEPHDSGIIDSFRHSPEKFNFSILKYNIPNCERKKVIRFLNSCNLTAYTLFGDEASIIETMKTYSYDCG